MNKKSYLPPESQPWARSIELEAVGNAELIKLNKINVDNELYQIKPVVSLLTRRKNEIDAQFSVVEERGEYLSTLQTYTTSSPGAVTVNGIPGGSTIFLPVKNLSVQFYLSRPATIILKARCDTFVNSGYSSYSSILKDNGDGTSSILKESRRRTFRSIVVNGTTTLVTTSMMKSDNDDSTVVSIPTAGMVKFDFYVTLANPGVGKYMTASNAIFSATVVN